MVSFVFEARNERLGVCWRKCTLDQRDLFSKKIGTHVFATSTGGTTHPNLKLQENRYMASLIQEYALVTNLPCKPHSVAAGRRRRRRRRNKKLGYLICCARDASRDEKVFIRAYFIPETQDQPRNSRSNHLTYMNRRMIITRLRNRVEQRINEEGKVDEMKKKKKVGKPRHDRMGRFVYTNIYTSHGKRKFLSCCISIFFFSIDQAPRKL